MGGGRPAVPGGAEREAPAPVIRLPAREAGPETSEVGFLSTALDRGPPAAAGRAAFPRAGGDRGHLPAAGGRITLRDGLARASPPDSRCPADPRPRPRIPVPHAARLAGRSEMPEVLPPAANRAAGPRPPGGTP